MDPITQKDLSELRRTNATVASHFDHWENGQYASYEAMLINLCWLLAQGNDPVSEADEKRGDL